MEELRAQLEAHEATKAKVAKAKPTSSRKVRSHEAQCTSSFILTVLQSPSPTYIDLEQPEAGPSKPRHKATSHTDDESEKPKQTTTKGKEKEKRDAPKRTTTRGKDKDKRDIPAEDTEIEEITQPKVAKRSAAAGKKRKKRESDTEMSEDVEIVEDSQPTKPAKPRSKGREGSVQSQSQSQGGEDSVNGPAKPKKRKLNVFAGVSAVPPMFDFGRSQVGFILTHRCCAQVTDKADFWQTLGNLNGIDIPSVLSPVKASEVPARSKAGLSHSHLRGF
jgi:hypothetical protein